MNLLEVKNISKTYGSGETAVKALKNVSFSVPKGEYVAIVGESGSGKSTLLNMIGALDTPTSGKVLIDGKDIFSMNDRKLTVFRRRNIGFIFSGVPDSGVYEGRPDCYEPECEIFGRYDGRRLGYGHDPGWRSRSERELYGLSLDESSM